MTSQVDRAGERRRAAVLGHPIGHSYSPLLHRAAYAELGLPWTYDAIDVSADEVTGFVGGLGPEWVGVSLTMPLKEAVLPVLTQRSPVVELTQAANTVVVRGALRSGHNTDVTGLVSALSEAGVVSTDSAAILGSGATARSALVALDQLGAATVTVVAREGDSARTMGDLGRTLGVRVDVIGWAQVADALVQPLVVSTVPSAVVTLTAQSLPNDAGLLFDVIYGVEQTPLAAAWSRRGRVLDGFDLLVHQAVGQIELMTGATVPVEVLRRALPPRG